MGIPSRKRKMTAKKCAVCSKTAYPLEAVTAGDLAFHKMCFKCTECKITLNVKNYKLVDKKVYCHPHTPVDRSTTGADSVSAQSAKNAPKPKAEALGAVQKGTGDAHTAVVDYTMSKAMSAPKAKAEGLGAVQKGTGDAHTSVVDYTMTKAMNAPKA